MTIGTWEEGIKDFVTTVYKPQYEKQWQWVGGDDRVTSFMNNP